MVEQDGRAKYRVGLGGKITVYNHVSVKMGKSFVEQIYESNLLLQEMGKISKAEMTMWKNKFSQNRKDINAIVVELMVRV